MSRVLTKEGITFRTVEVPSDILGTQKIALIKREFSELRLWPKNFNSEEELKSYLRKRFRPTAEKGAEVDAFLHRMTGR